RARADGMIERPPAPPQPERGPVRMAGPPGPRLWRDLRRQLRGDPFATAALVVLGAIALGAIGAPALTPYDPLAVDFSQALQPPATAHPLGTDNFGRDVLSRILFGGRTSLGAAVAATAALAVLSLLAGVLAGYAGGWVDLGLSRVMDVLLAFPRLVLAIAVAALLGGSTLSVVVALTAVSWPAYARIIRSFVLQTKHEGYVLAAHASGASPWRIMRHHVLGAVVGPMVILVTLDLSQVILSLASLSFLGLGTRPPAPEWGTMLNEGRSFIEEAPWLFFVPGLAIFLVVICANYLGDTLRDALDPRQDALRQAGRSTRPAMASSPPATAPAAPPPGSGRTAPARPA
ncbi:MAG TPA: nickel transporter permease, partial [Chloroflexota bacterium]|nr:nickel transporter permease [Chloroflexota bacterium]